MSKEKLAVYLFGNIGLCLVLFLAGIEVVDSSQILYVIFITSIIFIIYALLSYYEIIRYKSFDRLYIVFVLISTFTFGHLIFRNVEEKTEVLFENASVAEHICEKEAKNNNKLFYKIRSAGSYRDYFYCEFSNSEYDNNPSLIIISDGKIQKLDYKKVK